MGYSVFTPAGFAALQTANHGASERLIYVIGAPPVQGRATLLDPVV